MDIISLFKVADSDVMPVFVARSLEKLPPITFDHLDVSKLLKILILNRLQSEIKNIKSFYVTITQVEKEVEPVAKYEAFCPRVFYRKCECKKRYVCLSRTR